MEVISIEVTLKPYFPKLFLDLPFNDAIMINVFKKQDWVAISRELLS